MTERKRLKIRINEVPRTNEIVDIKDIPKILRRKWISTALKNSNQFDIQVLPPSFVEEYTYSGWSVHHNGKNKIIKLKDCVGKVEIFDIDKIIEERKVENKGKEIDLFENVIAQAKLIFLSGKYKNFECAFRHIENRINYEKELLSSFQDSKNEVKKIE